MKKYKFLVMLIVIIGFTFIATSNQVKNVYNLVANEDNDTKAQENIYKICIDPGHQEKGDTNLEQIAPGSPHKKARVSSGTCGVSTKKPEYVLNLETSLILKHILENRGYKVIMTRETHDVNISNSERAIIANNENVDMVVRIHADGLDDSSKSGASILIPEEGGKYTASIFEQSNLCAQSIKESMINNNIKINGVFERNDLTGFNWSTVPVVLIEMGFMSNYNEDQMMSNIDYQNKLMNSIADGIQQYFNQSDR